MQDEINSRVVALSIRVGIEGTKLTTRALQATIRKYLNSMEKIPAHAESGTSHGKQTVGKLMQQNTQLINIDVMKAAFQEYAGKSIAKTKKPSIRRLLFKSQEKARRLDREKVRQKDRAKER